MDDKQAPSEEQPKMQNEEPVTSVPQVRKLTRNRDDKVIAGVASGLGAYFGIDPVLIRVAFVVMVFLGGTGVLLYLLLWLALPVGPNESSVGEAALRRGGDWPSWIGIVLIVVAVASLANGFNWWEPELVWGLGLMALGVYLLVHQEPASAPASPHPPIGPPAPRAPGATPDTNESSATVVKRPRSVLGLLTLGAALLASGAAVILDNLDVLEMNPSRYLALALAIVGLGLVAGAWWGRSPGLIVLGVLLAPVVFLGGLIDVPFAGGAGERFWQPQTVSGIRDEYRLAAGSMTLDLANVDFAGETVEVNASVAMGELIVVVPDDVGVDVNGEVGAGEIIAFGSVDEGVNLDLDTSIDDGGGGHLVLNVDAGLGSVQIRQAGGVQ